MPVDICMDSSRLGFAERVYGAGPNYTTLLGALTPLCLQLCLNGNSELCLSPPFFFFFGNMYKISRKRFHFSCLFEGFSS